ncbi:MAG: glutamate synthase [Desulfobacteraceae bacterium]|nr:MAG: glutamate synthase [Desulfobacteraceae bacterium]
MCRLLAITSDDFISPVVGIEGLNAMHEGYDGSGVGLLLRDLGGPFENMKDSPILSGIFSESGLKKLDNYMLDLGFTTKYKISFKIPKNRPAGIPQRDIYLVRAYDYPNEWEKFNRNQLYDQLMNIRLQLKKMGEAEKDMIVFSFWPDTIMIKEIGDPLDVAEYLELDRKDLKARVIMVQGRQNTNYSIDLYSCHPFFLQGFSTMTNGENTAFITNKEFLSSRGFAGYNGYMSDSEIFTHILHYSVVKLGLDLEAYKHIITPLTDSMLETHPDAAFLRHLKYSCRQMIIDGPNCVVGCLPDNTLFMVQDRKKLRPGIIGGDPGMYVLSSETCGLDAVLPNRDKSKDFQPMHMDTAIVAPDRKNIRVVKQTDPFLKN